MNTHEDRTPTPPSEPVSEPVDLAEATEPTRRALYDAAVETHFTPTPEEREKAQADQAWTPPPYTPEQAGLAIHHLYGRWFVVWRVLEEKEGEAPPERLWTVLRVTRNPEGTFDYLEV